MVKGINTRARSNKWFHWWGEKLASWNKILLVHYDFYLNHQENLHKLNIRTPSSINRNINFCHKIKTDSESWFRQLWTIDKQPAIQIIMRICTCKIPTTYWKGKIFSELKYRQYSRMTRKHKIHFKLLQELAQAKIQRTSWSMAREITPIKQSMQNTFVQKRLIYFYLCLQTATEIISWKFPFSKFAVRMQVWKIIVVIMSNVTRNIALNVPPFMFTSTACLSKFGTP